MTTFRNFASHDYFGLDANLVWKAAMGLTAVKEMLEAEQRRLRADFER